MDFTVIGGPPVNKLELRRHMKEQVGDLITEMECSCGLKVAMEFDEDMRCTIRHPAYELSETTNLIIVYPNHHCIQHQIGGFRFEMKARSLPVELPISIPDHFIIPLLVWANNEARGVCNKIVTENLRKKYPPLDKVQKDERRIPNP